jgi:hypothetical protein
MASYVPPHSRNKGSRTPSWKIREEERENERLSNLVQTESNFPTLSSGESKTRPKWGGQKSFAALATEWKEKTDEEKEAEEHERLRQVRMACTTAVPRFYRMHSIEENEVYESGEIIDKPQNADEDWTLISKKARPPPKEVTHEQLDKEYAAIEKGNDEKSMWNDEPRDYETYWDERRI